MGKKINTEIRAIIMVSLLFSLGCAPINLYYPIVSGSHSPQVEEELRSNNKQHRIVVWGNHPAMTNKIIVFLQTTGYVIVERSYLEKVIEEQKIILTNTKDDEANLLRVGELIGSDIIVFAETTMMPEEYNDIFILQGLAGGSSGIIYKLSVGIRAVSVESGEILWSGISSLSRSASNPDPFIQSMTEFVLEKIFCPYSLNYKWVDPSRERRGGCIEANEPIPWWQVY